MTLGLAHLADHQTGRAHAQRLGDQSAQGDLARTLEVRLRRLEERRGLWRERPDCHQFVQRRQTEDELGDVHRQSKTYMIYSSAAPIPIDLRNRALLAATRIWTITGAAGIRHTFGTRGPTVELSGLQASGLRLLSVAISGRSQIPSRLSLPGSSLPNVSTLRP
jgi:hypothetical protein